MLRSHPVCHPVGGRACSASPVDARCASPIPSPFATEGSHPAVEGLA
jgi:hypothetical protein